MASSLNPSNVGQSVTFIATATPQFGGYSHRHSDLLRWHGSLKTGDGDYRLTPYDPAFEKKMAKAEEIMGRHRNTLHALAK